MKQNSFGCFQKWSVRERLQSVHESPSFEASDCLPNKDSRSLTAAYCNFFKFVGRDIKSWKQHNSSSMGLGFPKNILSESPPSLIAYFRREETLWIGRCRRCHQWFNQEIYELWSEGSEKNFLRYCKSSVRTEHFPESTCLFSHGFKENLFRMYGINQENTHNFFRGG